jgi:hypothetical protein
MQSYVEKLKPNATSALMDDETRFWIAQQVADTKYTANINPLFKNGKQKDPRKQGHKRKENQKACRNWSHSSSHIYRNVDSGIIHIESPVAKNYYCK